MDLTLDNIKFLAQLVVDLKLDSLKLGDLELHKTKHEQPKLDIKSNNDTVSNQELDEILFHSTSAPSLTLEDLEAMSITPIKKARK